MYRAKVSYPYRRLYLGNAMNSDSVRCCGCSVKALASFPWEWLLVFAFIALLMSSEGFIEGFSNWLWWAWIH